MQTTGLVRVTVSAPQRRIDMALPEHAPLAEVLPGVLSRAGEDLADAGVTGGGWVLRRADGTELALGRTLAAHRVRDGEILHLTPGQLEWPELEYDDLVDAIATGSGRVRRPWGPRHTRLAGLAAGVLALLLGLVVVLRAGPSWDASAFWALGAAAVLLAVAAVLARAVGDAGAGVVVAACALPFAFTGGGLVLAGDRPVGELSAGHLLLAGAVLLLAAVLGMLAVTAAPALFTGGITVGLSTVLGAALSTWDLSAHESAAVVGGVLLMLTAAYATLSLRLGRVPMPVLPRSTADLVRDDPQPPLSRVHACVLRADAFLTGMLTGTFVVVSCCVVVLARGASEAGVVLAGLLAAGFLLRSRVYPVLHHRVPVLATGVVAVGAVVAGPLITGRVALLAITAPALVLVAAGAIAAGIAYSARAAGPYPGRLAEYAEILVMVAVVPVTCSVLGLYGYVRGLGG
ncbi:type VII secretion integral membrane protein EccD [Actinophytocola sp. NPDC049390]|uniref:type VII secretion integral membrane protein EccD n=1 Tax=Actinophytocola sp. NPDC049390 TaxID=3363894 RepID=UPI0037AA30CF